MSPRSVSEIEAEIEVARTSPQGTTFALHFPPGAVQG